MSATAKRTGVERIVFWASMAIGAVVVGIGVQGLRSARLIDLPSSASGKFDPGTFVPFFVGGAVLIDLVVIPLAATAGLVARRVVPRWAWPAVRAGLLATATLVLFAYPLVTDKGGNPGNPTVRPRDYGAGLVWAIVATWVVSLGYLGYCALAARRTRSSAAD